MDSFRKRILGFGLVAFIVIGACIMAGLKKLVKNGTISAGTLTIIVVAFIAAVLLTLIILGVRAVKNHNKHLAQSSSSDILADIIRLGEQEKQDKPADN